MKKTFALLISIFAVSSVTYAADLKAGDAAPPVHLQTQENKPFDLNDRKGQWTVLYFYPKAETPGCTKQACTYRDSIQKIRALGADVYGISADSTADIAKFHENHHLNFTLLADPDDNVIKAYGTKMPMLSMSKRWTFIIDPDLKIRDIVQGVDPVKDAAHVAEVISNLQASAKK